MEKRYLVIILLAFLLPLCSFDNKGGRTGPVLPNKTLDGKTIDDAYYKGHVTIVSFMFIGCLPCMNEIGVLNRIKREYAANDQLQILCIARQMREQMIQFNDDSKTSPFSMLRKAMKVDPITYTILPGCDEAPSKMKDTQTDSVREVYLKSECNTIEEKCGIAAFPTIFFVDKKGMVRKVKDGGPGKPNDEAFYNEVKQEIDALLSE